MCIDFCFLPVCLAKIFALKKPRYQCLQFRNGQQEKLWGHISFSWPFLLCAGQKEPARLAFSSNCAPEWTPWGEPMHPPTRAQGTIWELHLRSNNHSVLCRVMSMYGMDSVSSYNLKPFPISLGLFGIREQLAAHLLCNKHWWTAGC